MVRAISTSTGDAATIARTAPVQASSKPISNSVSLTSLPLELIHYIATYLIPKDVGNMRLCNREIYYKLSGPDFDWYQRVFQNAMLHLGVRIWFFMHHPHASYYQGKLNAMSYLKVNKVIADMRQIIKNQFVNMGIHQQGKVFQESASAGCTEILTAMANSPCFFDIKRFELLSSFRAAASNGQVDALKVFLQLHTKQLCLLNKCSIGTAVLQAADSSQYKAVSEIRGWNAFGNFQVSTIVQAAQLAINNDDPLVMEELMQCARFYKMNDGQLFFLFQRSVQEGRLQVVQLFLRKPAFLNRIDRDDFGLIFLLCIGCLLIQKDIMKELIHCHRFNDISPEYLGRALLQTAQYNRSDLFYEILNSGRFDEIPNGYKAVAYVNALEIF